MYYPKLYPTPTNNISLDFADDETVCISNVDEKCDDDSTAATEDVTSDEDSAIDVDYIPPTKDISRPPTPTMPTRTKA
jgi:hypothetical protein